MYIVLDEFFVDESWWKVYTAKELTIENLNLFGWKQQKASFRVRPHHHPGLFEFHYLQDGNFTFWAKGQEYNVSGGYVFVNFPGEYHEAHFAIPGGHQFYWFQLPDSGSVLGLDHEKSTQLIQRLKQIQHRSIPVNHTMEWTIREAFNHSRSQGSYYQQYAETQLACFLYTLLEVDATMNALSVSPEIQRAITYMEENLQQYTAIPTLAAYVGLSESHFRTKFRKELGMSPADYYTGMRMNEAKRLLEKGFSITETANALDFSTPNYFSTVFHRITNMTPSDYRKKHHL